MSPSMSRSAPSSRRPRPETLSRRRRYCAARREARADGPRCCHRGLWSRTPVALGWPGRAGRSQSGGRTRCHGVTRRGHPTQPGAVPPQRCRRGVMSKTVAPTHEPIGTVPTAGGPDGQAWCRSAGPSAHHRFIILPASPLTGLVTLPKPDHRSMASVTHRKVFTIALHSKARRPIWLTSLVRPHGAGEAQVGTQGRLEAKANRSSASPTLRAPQHSPPPPPVGPCRLGHGSYVTLLGRPVAGGTWGRPRAASHRGDGRDDRRRCDLPQAHGRGSGGREQGRRAR